MDRSNIKSMFIAKTKFFSSIENLCKKNPIIKNL